MRKAGYVYILTNFTSKVVYVGVTSNLKKRVWEHKNKIIKGFTQKYNIEKLVYFEHQDIIKNAIQREKQIKNLIRRKKNELIASINPEWKDLYSNIYN